MTKIFLWLTFSPLWFVLFCFLWIEAKRFGPDLCGVTVRQLSLTLRLWPFDVTKLAFSPRDIHLWPVPFSMLGAQVMNLLLIVFHLKEVKILSYFQVWLKSWKMTFSRMFQEFIRYSPHFIFFTFLSHFSVSEHQNNFNIRHKIQLLN